MNILLVGSGGREHAFAIRLKESPRCSKLYTAPGNAGTAQQGTNLDIQITDFISLAAASLKHKIDLILVGPEEPLVKGITDFFQKNELTKHIKIIGPCMAAAQLEGSKAFAKEFMVRHQIPTAFYREFTKENFEEGKEYIRKHKLPVVLKADGLAAGKGVLICENTIEALAEFDLMIMRSKFGEAGKKVVVEEFLDGIEMSIFLLTDGTNYLFLPEAKDYKRIGEGDTGLNTGGMGAVSPVPILTPDLKNKIITNIAAPTINGLQKDELDYCGFVFIGLMVNNGEPYVIEYNCRMGDPETEVVLPRLKNDLVDILDAAAEKKLSTIRVAEDPRSAVAVVGVSDGYPGDYKKGAVIEGLETMSIPNSVVIHAGTKNENGSIVSNGGRVLVAVSLGENILEAAEQSNYVLSEVSFKGMNFRTDIGHEFK